VGRFDSRRWWTVLTLIPFTTPPNRGLRTSAFCGELQKAEFERNVICKRTLTGLKAARARGRVGCRPEKLSIRERRQDYQRADAIKRANPASWKHVNLYGAYSFLDIGVGLDLQELVNLLEAARGRGAAAPN